MSVNNLNNHHLTEPEINAILNALNDLERAMEPLNINLTPEDRNKYGRVDEQNKLFINKVHDFATQQTNLRTMDVDWDEFEKDFKSRAVLENIISRLNNLSIRANNSKIFHDFDNYQDALADYAYTQFRANSKIVGFEDKYNELRQFFAKSKRKQDKNQ
ncbi:MAG: hypothetical protein HXL37_04285 [Riemerella sp.]|nr:hypothetical protein [Riemerella sp.]